MALKDILRPEAPLGPPDEPAAAARELSGLTGTVVYPDSVTVQGQRAYFVSRRGAEKLVGLAFLGDPPAGAGARALEGDSGSRDGLAFRLGTANPETAEFLRRRLEFLQPKLAGLAAGLGLGDRLGIATAGHVRAVKGTGLAPFFAQQSIREMTRTARTPRQVLASAALGALEAGWRGGFGADADHLKTTQDADYCLEAGFTMFTFDPGDHVNVEADRLGARELAESFARLPWTDLESGDTDCRRRYAGRTFDLKGASPLTISEEALLRAAVKYGRAVAHVKNMYRHLVETAGDGRFEVEVSVDETDSPTGAAEHYYVAAELSRLGVKWVSLAPRFVGRFEKGVDYIGDLDELRRALRLHAAVARTLGPYKLSIHSGSDKFSVYGPAAEACNGLVHVKTAGTSYLEALRTLAAGADRELFREILTYAAGRYDEDRKSYHVSAEVSKAMRPEALRDDDLAAALDEFNTRQVLHVTYGSVLGARDFKPRLMRALDAHEELHYAILARHLGRHAAPFARK